MNFELTDIQREIQRLCREFAARELIPNARKWDETARAGPTEAVKKLAELSLLGVAVPEEYGGAGLDNVCYALAMEEISRGCASTGVIMSVNNSLFCDPVLKFGTEEQKKRVPHALRAAARSSAASASPSPRPAATRPRRRPSRCSKGDEYVINGSKNWITNGPQGRRHRPLHDDRPRRRATRASPRSSCPPTRPGFTRAEPDQKMGIRAAHSCTMFFEDMRGAREEPPRQGGRGLQGRHEHARRRPHRHRLAGARHRARGLRGGGRATRRSARPSASPSATTRRSSSCSPTWPRRSTRRACSRCARR